MFPLTDEQRMISEAAADFSAARLRPNAKRWDRDCTLDREVLTELAELGFAAIYVGEEGGGSGLGRLEAALIFEQLSRGCVSHASFLSIHNMVAWMLDRFGQADLKARFLPALCEGRLIASYCLTEANHGSDAANLRTRARRDGDSYLLDGAKQFISGGGFSDVYLVMARTEDSGARGISSFLVEKGTPGLSFGALERKMGWNAQPTAQVLFEGCRIPAANRLGEEGEGFKFAMQGLNGGRLNIAACSLGGAQDAMDRAVDYVRQRKQFGQALADFQATQFKLADMAVSLASARTFLYAAAAAMDRGEGDIASQNAMVKRYATDVCFEVANQALQLHGGYGYLADYEVERIVRDLRVHQILEGTNEIMRVMIARALLRA